MGKRLSPTSLGRGFDSAVCTRHGQTGGGESRFPCLRRRVLLCAKALHGLYYFLGSCEATVRLLVGNGANKSVCSPGERAVGSFRGFTPRAARLPGD